MGQLCLEPDEMQHRCMGCVRRPSPRTPYTCDRIRNTSTTLCLQPPWGTLPAPWPTITRPAYPMNSVLESPSPPPQPAPYPDRGPPQLTYTERRLHRNAALPSASAFLSSDPISGCISPVVPIWGPLCVFSSLWFFPSLICWRGSNGLRG